MSSWISLPKVDPSNPEYLLSPFRQSFEEKYGVFVEDVSIQDDIRWTQSEMPQDNVVARSRNVPNTFGVYQPHVIFNHPIIRVNNLSQMQSERKITEDFLQGQAQSTTIHDANVSGSTIPNKKNKRMIKNRESAARSRARRQAYTSQLEIEVKHLKEENNMLKENLKKIQSDITILQEGKRRRPSSSAEF